ncbi:hypothetical protein DL768_002379 [Monosporascus sp. mg162]|nr:hypothetical protein DL768_002379 [Monosporascus sp. mg162]
MGIATRTASPTIIFCCEVALHRREIRNIIKNSGILDKYPGIKTGHMPRAPDFDRLVPLAPRADNWTTARISIKRSLDAPGCQLVVEWSRIDMEWSTKATVGGVIRVRNKYFYTTAAHTFQPDITASSTTGNFGTDIFEASDEDCCSFDGDSESEVDSEEIAGSSCQFTEPLGSYDDKLETLIKGKTIWDNPADQSREQLIQDNPTAPDRPPRLDSEAVALVYDFEFDHPGEVFVATLERPETGLDYALIEVEDPRHCTENTTTGVSDPQSRIVIKSLARELSDDAAVIAVTPHGRIPGNLSATPSYVRTPDGKKFHEMFTVIVDAKLETGDCGSWVINAETGNLYGHIVAGCLTSGATFITPFTDVFEDIERHIGFAPEFPVSVNDPIHTSSETRQPRDQRGGNPINIREYPSSKQLQGITASDKSWTVDSWIKKLREQFEQRLKQKRQHHQLTPLESSSTLPWEYKLTEISPTANFIVRTSN